MKKQWLLILFILVAIDIAYGQGCSQCKLITEQATELDEQSFGTSINKGILFLLAVPYIMLMILFRKHIIRLFKSIFRSENAA